jgi:hypothetical protein
MGAPAGSSGATWARSSIFPSLNREGGRTFVRLVVTRKPSLFRGQTVRLKGGSRRQSQSTGLYRTTGTLPTRTNSPQYRIRNEFEGHESALLRGALEPSPRGLRSPRETRTERNTVNVTTKAYENHLGKIKFAERVSTHRSQRLPAERFAGPNASLHARPPSFKWRRERELSGGGRPWLILSFTAYERRGRHVSPLAYPIISGFNAPSINEQFDQWGTTRVCRVFSLRCSISWIGRDTCR